MRLLPTVLLLAVALSPGRAADSVVVEASRDATLIEHPDGARANGSGPYLFSGRTGQATNGVRRALLVFDVAAAVPRHAIVERVRLILTVDTNNGAPADLRVHRVLADWGEGASSASGGGGAPAGPGDVTWIHTFHDDAFWVHSGGQFLGRESALQTVGGSGVYTWDGTVQMAADVRLWLANPRRNFGWIVIGDETTPQTSKAIVSREHPEPALRPALEIEYRLPAGHGRDDESARRLR